jgi:hypothetical protein
MDRTRRPVRFGEGTPLEQRLEGVDWGRSTLVLTRIAYKLTFRGSWETAEDLAKDAITAFFARAHARWEPEVPLDDFLVSLLNNEVSNWKKKKSTTSEVAMPKRLHPPATGERESPESLASDAERAAIVCARLEKRATSDGPVTGLVAKFRSWVDSPKDQAAQLGMDMQQVRNARKRLFRHHEEIERELQEEERGKKK